MQDWAVRADNFLHDMNPAEAARLGLEMQSDDSLYFLSCIGRISADFAQTHPYL